MAGSCTVLVAAPELLPALRDHLTGDDPVLAFSDAEPLAALAAITRERPRLVVLERLFAASPRGAALIARVKSDPTLRDSEIRVLSHDGAYSRVSPRRPPIVISPGLDAAGTRRAPRIRMKERIVVLVDANPATLIDLSVIGAQIVSPSVVRPNQRVKLVLKDDEAAINVSATIVWARLEPNRGAQGPTFRAGVEFAATDAGPIEAYAERHTA